MKVAFIGPLSDSELYSTAVTVAFRSAISTRKPRPPVNSCHLPSPPLLEGQDKTIKTLPKRESCKNNPIQSNPGSCESLGSTLARQIRPLRMLINIQEDTSQVDMIDPTTKSVLAEMP